MLGDHFKIRVLYEKVRLILVLIFKKILAEMFKPILLLGRFTTYISLNIGIIVFLKKNFTEIFEGRNSSNSYKKIHLGLTENRHLPTLNSTWLMLLM
jgi:hypothetical protein